MPDKTEMRCCDCEHFRSVWSGIQGICRKGHGEVRQIKDGLPLAYKWFNAKPCSDFLLIEIERSVTNREDRAKPESLLKIFKNIVDTYTAEEVGIVVDLLRKELKNR